MTQSISQELYQKVEAALDTMRPHLAVDGGNVELVDISPDHVVSVRWLGNCESCKMSIMTLRAGIEQAIKSAVPEIKEVKALNGLSVDS